MARLHSLTLDEIMKLELPERLEAISAIWESIPESEKTPILSENEKRILDFSMEYSAKYPDDHMDWDSVRAQLHERLAQQ